MSTKLQMSLVDAKEWCSNDGKHYRREEWLVRGGEIDPIWQREANSSLRGADWEPSSRFTLYVVDGVLDVRLACYGGIVWPTAWPSLFRAVRQGTYQAAVEITDDGCMFRSNALARISDAITDETRVS